MKVDDIFQTIDLTQFPLNELTVQDLLDRRYKTYSGFLAIEGEKGFLKQGHSWASSQGQEIARILMFRVLEEVIESRESQSRVHRLEELIDAVNYLWELLLIHSSSNNLTSTIHEWAFEILAAAQVFWERDHEVSTRFNFQDGTIFITAIQLGQFGECLRNRSWMEQAQSLYFDGGPKLKDLVGILMLELFTYFESWEEFVMYFIAKDEVLKFRLRSRY